MSLLYPFLLPCIPVSMTAGDSVSVRNWPHQYAVLMLSVIFAVCSTLCKELGYTVIALCFAYDLLMLNKVCPILLSNGIDSDSSTVKPYFYKRDFFQKDLSLFLERDSGVLSSVYKMMKRWSLLSLCVIAVFLMRVHIMKSFPKYSK